MAYLPKILPPSPRVDKSHQFAKNLRHAWFPGETLGIDHASGLSMLRDAPAIEITPWGRGTQPAGTGDIWDQSTLLTWPQDNAKWTLSFLYLSTTGAHENNGALGGWNGVDDFVIYPADNASNAAGGRVFWRDGGGNPSISATIPANYPIWLSFSVGAASSTAPVEFAQTIMEGGRDSNGDVQAVTTTTSDTTGAGTFAQFSINGHLIGQYAGNCRILAVTLHDRVVPATEFKHMVSSPLWNWLDSSSFNVLKFPEVAAATTGSVYIPRRSIQRPNPARLSKHSITRGLVGAFWPMGGNHMVDLTGNTTPTTDNSSGDVTTLADAVSRNNVPYFSGDATNDRINLGSIPSTHPINLSTEGLGTIAYLHLPRINANTDFPRIFDKSNAGNMGAGWGIYHDRRANPADIVVGVGGTAIAVGNNVVVGQSATGDPEHVVVRIDPTQQVMSVDADCHLNGASVGTIAAGNLPAIPSTTTNAAIGGWNTDASHRPAAGGVAFVLIWNRILSDAEVLSLYAPQTKWDFLQQLNVIAFPGAAAAAASGIKGGVFRSAMFGTG